MDYVLGLSREEFDVLWLAITQIEAQNALLQLTINDYPHANKSQRDKVHKELHKQAYPKNFSSPVTTTKDLFKQLSMKAGL